MIEGGSAEKRINIGYLDGINSLTSHNVAKATEIYHAENARSPQIGSVEKRQGQTTLGTGITATGNNGLFYFKNSGASNQGLYRFTKTAANTAGKSTFYYLNNSNVWTALTGDGADILDGQVDTAKAEGNVFIVNGTTPNRYISGTDGTTVVTSATASGHLYNSPMANKICYYKNRLYLADFTVGSTRYKTTVMRSSYPIGLISLIDTDLVTAGGSGLTVNVTDTKYIYSTSGANSYEVYRGTTKICDLVVTAFTGNTLTATISNMTTASILAADELWVSGTYTGAKIFRWANSPFNSGTNLKQYDTFKMLGDDNESITMLTKIGNVMMIANPGSMGSWNDYTLENFDLGIGCCSKKGHVKLMGSLYFLDYNGVYATSGGVPKLLSNKVERYISGATKAGKEAAVAGRKGRSVFFCIGDVTLYNADGSLDKTMLDVCLEYSITQENWFVHTNVKANQMATFLEATDSDRLMLTDDTDFKVKEFLSGETDDGKEIFMRVDLPKYSLTSLWDKLQTPMNLLIDTERGSSIKAFVSVTEGSPEYYELEGKIDKGVSVIKIHNKDSSRVQPPPTRLICVSLRDSSRQLCRINRIAITFVPTNQTAVQP